MDANKLKGLMVEKKYTQLKLARELKLSAQSLNAKLNGRNQFTLNEVVEISKILSIEDPRDIFFTGAVPNPQRKSRAS
jgi:DNA-binding XRE family transcriptional regulator